MEGVTQIKVGMIIHVAGYVIKMKSTGNKEPVEIGPAFIMDGKWFVADQAGVFYPVDFEAAFLSKA